KRHRKASQPLLRRRSPTPADWSHIHRADRKLAGTHRKNHWILGKDDRRALDLFGPDAGEAHGLDLCPEHLVVWLALWEINCRCHLKPAEAMEMISLAHEVGRRLGSILFNNEPGATK